MGFLGLLFQDQGKMAEAETVLRRALKVSEETLGQPIRTIKPACDLASFLRDQGKLVKENRCTTYAEMQ